MAIEDDGNSIVLYTIEDFNNLLEEGFEIESVDCTFPPGIMNLILVRGEDRIVAVANPIFEHILHLKPLYDFNKKKNSFVYVSDVDVYFKFESVLEWILPGDTINPLITIKLNSSSNGKMYQIIYNWTKEISNKRCGGLWYDIFSLICIIKEKNGTFSRSVLAKESFTIHKKDSLYLDAKMYDNVVAVSYFLLGNTFPKTGNMSDDMIIGIIVYDLKNRRVVAFNVQSYAVFLREHSFDKGRGLYDIVIHLFNITVNRKLQFKSYPPLPMDSPWFTVLPWICFSVLLPIENDKKKLLPKLTVNIPEFFIFGFNLLPVKLNSFVFKHFSETGRGRASCILNVNDNGRQITLNLRFDQSLGEPLVHLDFSYYDMKQIKLIAHEPLDFEAVQEYNFDLFATMMFAGLFDGHFSTLFKDGIKGLKELAVRNSALLYPVYFIHILENLAQKLDQRAYNILEKLFHNKKLEASELNVIKRIRLGDFELVTENNGRVGLNLYGYAIILRYKRGQMNIRLT